MQARFTYTVIVRKTKVGRFDFGFSTGKSPEANCGLSAAETMSHVAYDRFYAGAQAPETSLCVVYSLYCVPFRTSLPPSSTTSKISVPCQLVAPFMGDASVFAVAVFALSFTVIPFLTSDTLSN